MVTVCGQGRSNGCFHLSSSHMLLENKLKITIQIVVDAIANESSKDEIRQGNLENRQ